MVFTKETSDVMPDSTFEFATPLRQKVDPPDFHPARLLFTTMVLSGVWSLLKFIIAWQTDSLAVLADSIFSLLAVMANVAGLMMIWLESRKGSRADIKASRTFQTRIILIQGALFSFIVWEIFNFMVERFNHPFFTRFHLLPAMIGIGSALSAQLIWWLLARQGPQQRALILSRQVGWMQNLTSLLAIAALPDLARNRPALDLMGAGLILLMIALSLYRMISTSLNALAEV